jgi:hypothetical protein
MYGKLPKGQRAALFLFRLTESMEIEKEIEVRSPIMVLKADMPSWKDRRTIRNYRCTRAFLSIAKHVHPSRI